jgi:exopolysaccharide biosynthesis polyprenyl glycosylphosphotransferase
MKSRNLNRLFMWVLTLGDMSLVSAAFLAGYWVRFRSGLLGSFVSDAARWEYYWRATPLVALVFWVVFKYAGLYRQRRGISSTDEFRRLLAGAAFSLLLLSAMAFFMRGFSYSIKVFIISGGLSLGALLVWRLAFRVFQISLRRQGVGVMRTVLVGAGPIARKVLERIRSNPGMGYRVVGVVDDEGAKASAKSLGSLAYLGPIRDLEKAVRAARADLVLIALPASLHGKTEEILLQFDLPGVELRIVSDLFSIITSPLSSEEIHGIPVFALKEAPLDRLGNRVIKRAFDLALVVPGLILISPVLLLAALAVKLSSRGPLFYAQERVSRGNLNFAMYKFRTMRVGAETHSGPVWTVKSDPRVTKVGAFLRRTSIDELPQLFNVFRGEMSLVGPRPERPFFISQFEKRFPRYLRRHQVKGGLTGWAQVNGLRGNTSIEERTRYDLYYVEKWSFSLDVIILARTVLELFEHKTAY